jgi:integrase
MSDAPGCEDYTLRDALHGYIKKRSLKVASVESLEGTIKAFLRYAKRPDIPIALVTPDVVNAWLASMTWRERTIIKHRKYLLLLLRDAVRVGQYPESIDDKVKTPQKPQPQSEHQPAQPSEPAAPVRRFRGSDDLTQFFRDEFVRDWLHACNPSVLQRYVQAVDWLFIWLERKPTFNDITDAKLEQFGEWLVATNRANKCQRTDTAENYEIRIRQIRRYALTKSAGCKRDMRLIDFLLDIYRKERLLADKSLMTLRQHVNSLSDFYGSPIMLSELDEAVLAGWLKRLKRDKKQPKQSILALWRLAFELGYVPTFPEAKKSVTTPAPIETNGDSLRLLMTSKYFPAKWSIQSDLTKANYMFAMGNFAEHLGHEPTLGDLSDDNVAGMMRMLQAKGMATTTINERRGRIAALWKWLASRGYLSTFPTIERIRNAHASPEAWDANELRQLFNACRESPGLIGELPAADWWLGLHKVLWETSERIGAVLDIQWDWLNESTLQLHVPAESRKGRIKEAFYTLTPETLETLDRLRSESAFVFPFPSHRSTFFNQYKSLLKRAGLPHGRKDMAHKMRRSVSSHLFAAGEDDTKALGHSDAYTTERSYRDPRICREKPLNLFKPWDNAG